MGMWSLFSEALSASVPFLQAHLDRAGDRRRTVCSTVPPLVCADGTLLSVQASTIHHCSPRSDFGPYESAEVAVSSRVVEWESFNAEPAVAEAPFVYRRVPLEMIAVLINRHGGLPL